MGKRIGPAPKPDIRTIREAVPLSALALRRERPRNFTCCICGRADDEAPPLTAWAEADERDRMTTRIVFLCSSPLCKRALDDHPRLYVELTGGPGIFPRLCGPCVHREGHECPRTKAKGGAGIVVHFDMVHFHIRGPGSRFVRNATECSDRACEGGR